MSWHTIFLGVVVGFLVLIVLAGCAPGMGALEGPPPRCMQSSNPLEDLHEGDNLVEKHAELRREYSTAISRERCLRRYASRVVNK